jgi:hypothetical protein
MMEEDRVRLTSIRPPENNEVRVLRLLVGAGPSTPSKNCRQTDDARGVSGPVTTVNIVTADYGPGKLLGEKVQLVGRF